MSSPKVTVIHTYYNHEKFVIESLESVKKQRFQDFEWIIIDDASADISVSLIKKWIELNQVKCQFIAHPKNIGFCATLNEALSLSKGEYISYFSADDLMREDKLKTQVAHLDTASEKVGVVYSDAYQIDDAGAELDQMFLKFHRNLSLYPEGNIYMTLVEGNFIPAPSTMIRRSVMKKLGDRMSV